MSISLPLPDPSSTSRYAQCRAIARRARGAHYLLSKSLTPALSRKPEAIAVAEMRAGVLPFSIVLPGKKPFLVPSSGVGLNPPPADDAA